MNETGDPRPGIRGSTRVVGVIGWPVEHSLSPAIHNAAFDALAMDWTYIPLPVPPGHVGEAIAGLRALGLAGANVTMPHKTSCAELLEDLSDDARRLRAVNTIAIGAGSTVGHNTDAPGFERFLRQDAGLDPSGRSALMFGAGGAARACALALARAGLASLALVVRDPSRADALLQAIDGLALEVTVVGFEEAEGISADLVVNATPLGVHGEVLPLPPLDEELTVVDLLYRPAETPLVRAARHAGAKAFGGIGLLLHQAALSFELWTGRPAPLPVMSAAALSALGDRGPSAER